MLASESQSALTLTFSFLPHTRFPSSLVGYLRLESESEKDKGMGVDVFETHLQDWRAPNQQTRGNRHDTKELLLPIQWLGGALEDKI